MRKVTCVLGGALLAVCAMPALGQDGDLDQQIRDGLGVSGYVLEDLALPESAGDSFEVLVSIAGEDVVVMLEPWSMRGDSFVVLTDDGSGNLVPTPVPAPLTYRGTVLDHPGSIVAGSLLPDGLSVSISMPSKQGGDYYFIQPLVDVVEGQPVERHVVYSAAQTLATGKTCGVENNINILDLADVVTEPDLSDRNGHSVWQAEIGFDADFPFYQKNGSNTAQTVADVENVMAVVTLVYERDTLITYDITTIIVRTSSGADPYSSTNPGTLLNQFVSHWNSQQGGVQRDVAHLMTGRNINGGVIGVAFLSVICNISNAYGLSESRFTTNMNSRAALTAHELGHNWSAPHCDGNAGCQIMCSGLGGCNGLNPLQFGPNATASIVNHRNSRNCLDEIIVGQVDLPFFDDFASGTIQNTLWTNNDGAQVVFNFSAPSDTFILNLDGNDSIETLDLAAANPPGPIQVSFFESRAGVENGESLVIEALNDQAAWIEIGRITSDGSDDPVYDRQIMTMPASSHFDGARVRLRTTGNSSTDDWFIDDFLIEAIDGLPLPFADSFDFPVLDTTNWPVSSQVSISTAANGEPSSPFSMEIGFVGSVESAKLRAADFGGSPLYLEFYTEELPGTDLNDPLFVEYQDALGTWNTLDIIQATGTGSTSFVFREYELPAAAEHNALKIRMRSFAFEVGDGWYIDDVVLDDQASAPVCEPDLTGTTDPNSPDYGVPDGLVDANDFFYFLDRFAAGDLSVADLTGSSDPNSSDYGVPDGTLDANDFFFYLSLFAAGC